MYVCMYVCIDNLMFSINCLLHQKPAYTHNTIKSFVLRTVVDYLVESEERAVAMHTESFNDGKIMQTKTQNHINQC